jgi:hypothetical protein
MNASTILDRLDLIINRDDYTRVIGLSVLNEFIKWVENEGDWTHMEYTDDSGQTVIGQNNYAVPTRFKREMDVTLIDANKKQTFLTEWRSIQMDKGVGITTQQTTPSNYWYFGGELFLFPAPSIAGDDIRQRIYRYSAALTDSTGASNELTDNHANLLICGSARDIFNIYEDYDAAKIWDVGSGDGKHNFKSEWDAFLKKEARKVLPSTTPRFSIRMK